MTMLRWFGHLIRILLSASLWRFSRQDQLEETPGWTQNSGRDYTSHLAMECLRIPQEERETP